MNTKPFTPPVPGELTRQEADEINRWLEEVTRQDRTVADGMLSLSDTEAGWHFSASGFLPLF